jgi:TPP-dependent pyruvate/acetoin dehydrogenase alpha subunit
MIKSEILQEIEEAIHFAETSPMPDPEDLIKGVYHE